jgi:hypothetical protein
MQTCSTRPLRFRIIRVKQTFAHDAESFSYLGAKQPNCAELSKTFGHAYGGLAEARPPHPAQNRFSQRGILDNKRKNKISKNKN